MQARGAGAVAQMPCELPTSCFPCTSCSAPLSSCPSGQCSAAVPQCHPAKQLLPLQPHLSCDSWSQPVPGASSQGHWLALIQGEQEWAAECYHFWQRGPGCAMGRKGAKCLQNLPRSCSMWCECILSVLLPCDFTAIAEKGFSKAPFPCRHWLDRGDLEHADFSFHIQSWMK